MDLKLWVMVLVLMSVVNFFGNLAVIVAEGERLDYLKEYLEGRLNEIYHRVECE